MTRWQLIWAVWTLCAFGSFLLLEFLALKDKTPGSVTLSEFGWHLMRHPVIHIAIAVFLGWLFVHFVFKGRII